MPSRFLSDGQLTRYGRHVGDPTEEQLAVTSISTRLTASWWALRSAHTVSALRYSWGWRTFWAPSWTIRRKRRQQVVAATARQLGDAVPPCLHSYHGRALEDFWRCGAYVMFRFVRHTGTVCR